MLVTHDVDIATTVFDGNAFDLGGDVNFCSLQRRDAEAQRDQDDQGLASGNFSDVEWADFESTNTHGR